MEFTKDERTLLIFYYTGKRVDTIKTLQDMHAWLEPDETELKEMTEGLIRKLEQMTDEEFIALDIFRNILI